MTLQLQVTDEDMMDLTGTEETEETVAQNAVTQAPAEKAAESEPAAASEATELVKHVKQLFGIPVDLDGEYLLSSSSHDETLFLASKKWYDDLRINTVHVYGVQDMSSDDLLAYFKDFDPASLEWVNDTSCNVIFDTSEAACRAMAHKMTHWVLKSSEAETTSSLPTIKWSELKSTAPDGTWLLACEHEKAQQLLIRFAKPDDKKKAGGGKFSQYYQKYGNPHFGNKKAVMSGSLAEKLKRMGEMEGELPDDEDEGFIKVPDSSPESPPHRPLGLKVRMKMHADEEEEKGKERSFSKFSSESEKKSVWDRLEKPSALNRLGNSSRGIQKASTRGEGQISIWSRLSLPKSSKSSTASSSGRRSILYSNIRTKQ